MYETATRRFEGILHQIDKSSIDLVGRPDMSSPAWDHRRPVEPQVKLGQTEA